MTKRQALLASIAGIVSMTTGRAKTESLSPSEMSGMTWNNSPRSVSFDLNTFTKFTFLLGTEKVEVTGKEIFDALKST